MVGPVVKVDPRELPQGRNIHWLGQQQYAELPAYVKGFDVCLMPFALNEATEYINPTKTLEYMAAGKPIVSTAVADVVHNFTPVVAVAHSHDGVRRGGARGDRACPNAELIARGLEQATEQLVGEHRRAAWSASFATRSVRARRARSARSAIATRTATSRPAIRTRALAAASEDIGD